MSCIPSIGRDRQYADGPPIPQSQPKWTGRKANRLNAQANDDDPNIRAIAANSPHATSDMILHALCDRDVTVRRAAVKNPAITPYLLRMAMYDDDPGIRAYAKLVTGGTDA